MPTALGSVPDLLSLIPDALAGGNGLGNAFGVGIHAVGGDLFFLAVAVHIIVIGVDEFTVSAVDGEVTHGIAAIVDVDLSEGFRHRGCRRSGDGKQSHECSCHQQQTQKSLFQVKFLL